MTTVTIHSRKGCHWCDKWEKEQSEWVPPYWNLTKGDGSVSSFPQFIIDVDGKTKTLVGYQTILEITAAIEELQNG